VVRLKGGDPCVFGRGGEEWQALRAEGVEVELVPGISSAVSVAGLAGIPVTFRGISRGFAVVTGHCQNPAETDWSRYAGVDTLVILMGVKCRAAIAARLIEAGRPPEEPVAFIEKGTTPEERVICSTLAEVAAGAVEVATPALFVVGSVVELRKELVGEALLRALVAA
jgi:siroheme synthase